MKRKNDDDENFGRKKIEVKRRTKANEQNQEPSRIQNFYRCAVMQIKALLTVDNDVTQSCSKRLATWK